ncbi:protein toll-like isoform X2 [Stegodyphus dumicola]|nr:protein toll-like isoform X2 [Stegodyphus dumicola]
MEGLIVFRLYLDDPATEKIEDGAFDNVLRLRRFHVRQSSIQKLPDFRKIRDSFRNLNFDNSRLTALEGDGLKGLYLMESLSFVNNSIRRVDPDVFEGTKNAFIFDVSYNLLTSLPPNLFDEWTNLRKVVLSHNQLLHVDQLFAIAHPWFIYLDFNNLTDVDAILHPNMTSVITVLLASNPIEKISYTSFNFKVPAVRFLYLDHCKITEFNASYFEQLEKLATVDLSFNLIEIIPKQTVGFGTKLEIDLIGNQIRQFDAEMTYIVKRIYLSQNKLRSLGRTLQYTQISEVSVARNELEYLSVEDLRGVHGMANIEFQGNRIRWMDRFTFFTIRNDLHYLDLSNNLIKSLNGSVKYLSQLKSLNLTQNLIKTFEEGEFSGLNELSELYLQDNRIAALSGQIQLIPQLLYLVIRQNNVKTLSADQIPEKLQYLYLADNPFKCDCRLLMFLRWLNSSEFPVTDIPLCTVPVEKNESSSLFLMCPEPCSCSCTEDSEEYFMALDCSARNLSTLPEFLTGNFTPHVQSSSDLIVHLLRRLEYEQTFDSQFEIRDEVLSIDLSNNRLSSLAEARLPIGLRQLHLANNTLQKLPESISNSLPKLRTVSLAGNPWECNCNTVGFKKWLLSKMDIVEDVNITRCSDNGDEESELGGKILWTLTDLDLCPNEIWFYVYIVFGLLTFFLICAAAMILYNRYELNIKVWLYAHGVSFVKEKDIDKDKRFDAFVSFSHKDEAFVIKNLISVLENKKPKIELCLHYKHFIPGEFIEDNIVNAVQLSKRTVLVLSKNFLESEWCLMEFRAAHVQALKDKVHRIIVIKLGELPEEIDPAIKLYLDSTTYLTWGEKYFWDNLFYVLPCSGQTQPKRKSFPLFLNNGFQTDEDSELKEIPLA